MMAMFPRMCKPSFSLTHPRLFSVSRYFTVLPGNMSSPYPKRSSSCPPLGLEELLSKDVKAAAPGHRRSASDSLEKPLLSNMSPCAYFTSGTESDEEPSDSSTEKIMVVDDNKSGSTGGGALIEEMDYIKKLEQEIEEEKVDLSLLPLQVFRDKLVIFQMQKTNKALKKKMDIMKRKKADAQAKYQELAKERELLTMIMWLRSKGIK